MARTLATGHPLRPRTCLMCFKIFPRVSEDQTDRSWMLQMGSLEHIVHDLHQSLVELLERPEILSLHAVRSVGQERQLHLKVRALCGEVEKVFDVLVDTGAQVSLVKAGLLPPECLTHSRSPVRLKVANGQYMVGGTKEAAIGLQFVNHRELSRPDFGKGILLQGRFYEAQMDCDMIIGYEFMMETDCGVLPAPGLHDPVPGRPPLVAVVT